MKPGLPVAQIRSSIAYDIVGRNALRIQRRRDERAIRKYSPGPDSPMNPMLRCLAGVKELMSAHYLSARYAPGVHPVAWVASGAPVEVLHALDFRVIYPENHAALCASRKMSLDLCQAAEDEGYSKDLCSYVRTDLGSITTGRTPVSFVPRPDLLLCCTNICQTVRYWYEVLAARFKVPLVVIDTPFLYEEPASDHQLAYVQRQFEEELVPTAERVAGRALRESAMHKVSQESLVATQLWCDILDRSRARPAPMTAFDGFNLMAPIVCMRGLSETTRYYRKVLAELDERIANGVGAIKEEHYRVLWDNLPVWYRLNRLSRDLATLGVNIVACDYTYAWGELAGMIDPADPFGSAARAYLYPILNRSTGQKLASMKRMIADFSVDGVILHSDRSCKPYSLGQIDQRDRIVDDVGVPALLLEADHNDPRLWAEEQNTGRIEAFVEMMQSMQ
jgi:benzoyl-CoA reductase/2-hydroxyglutaryl-CoA dehydratase subunit BcrC/BadD/HgdB